MRYTLRSSLLRNMDGETKNHIFSGALERSAGMENGILFEVLLFITNLNALIHNKLQLSASVFYGSLGKNAKIENN